MSEELTKPKSLKDCKSVDEIDLGKVELIRGDTPEDIKQKCLQLCKEYLGHNWSQQTVDTIGFRRITGGMTNQLYYCGIAEPSATSSAPQEVAVRLYGPKYFNNTDHEGNERLKDTIIALMTSENKLGPKVYGLFESGQILKYYPHRQFRLKEQNNPKLAAQVFKKLAAVHAMKVPIKVNTNWIFDDFPKFYETGYKKFPINQMIEDLNCETLKKHDLKEEMQWLFNAITKSKSPIVFSHHDFRGSNIMITEPNDEIILCDLESSSYGYRGSDFGSIALEWGRDSSEFGKPYRKYPNDETLKALIKVYIDESERILGPKYSQNKVNSMDQILKEVKLFSMVGNMFFVLFCIQNDENDSTGFPVDKKVFMKWGDNSYGDYWYLKEIFIKQNVFD